jgi:hypothetical protein
MLSDLESQTTYYVRAYVEFKNAQNQNQVIYGQEIQFKTI